MPCSVFNSYRPSSRSGLIGLPMAVVCLAAVLLIASTAACRAQADSATFPNRRYLPGWQQGWSWPGFGGNNWSGPSGVSLVRDPETGLPVARLNGGQGPAWLTSPLPGTARGKKLRLCLEAWRYSLDDEHFLSVEWPGGVCYLNNHWQRNRWQRLCCQGVRTGEARPALTIRSTAPSTFLIRWVWLEESPDTAVEEGVAPAGEGANAAPFPIGVYIRAENLGQAVGAPYNVVVTRPDAGSEAQTAIELARRSVGIIALMPEELAAVDEYARAWCDLPPSARPFHFYAIDEPELRSVRPGYCRAIRKSLRKVLPWATTATAMIRPGLTASYAPAYNALFMDQYPVPGEPLIRLYDSVIRARTATEGGTDIWAVVQAFGGGRFARDGWTRKPTPEEMTVLAVSALAAGARGLLFYRWETLAEDATYREQALALARRIRGLSSWLPLEPGAPPGVGLTLHGRVRFDPNGGPAVKLAVGNTPQGERALVAVNTLPYRLRMTLTGLDPANGVARDLWHGGREWISRGRLDSLLEPHAVRVWRLDGQQ